MRRQQPGVQHKEKASPLHPFVMVLFVFCIVLAAGCGQDPSQVQGQGPSNEPSETSTHQGNEHNTLSAELLEQAAALPAPADDELPDWHGTALTPEYFNRNVLESDIKDIAASGFNYVRVHYSYLNFVDENSLKPLDGNLRKLDQVIGWGITHGVHINVTLYELPGSRDDIMQNPDHYRQAVEIWEMIAKRYTNVPAAAVSYNLLNEPGYDVFTEEGYAAFANELADVIWRHDNQKIIVSDGMLGEGWDGAVASQPIAQVNPKVVQSLHFYPWHSLRRSAHLNLLQWPYAQGAAVNQTIRCGGEPLRVVGDFPAGTEISVFLSSMDNVNKGGLFVLQAGEAVIDRISLDGITPSYQTRIFPDEGNPDVQKAEFGDGGNGNGLEMRFALEDPASSVAFHVEGEENTNVYVRELMFRIPTETEGEYPVVDNTKKPQGFVYKKGNFRSVYISCAEIHAEEASTVTIAADGNITSEPVFPEVDVFDLDTMERYFANWRGWADEHHVRILCNEFSIPMALPATQRMAYLKSVLDVLDANRLPWAVHCERIEGWGPVVLEKELEAGNLVLAPDDSYVLRNGYYIDQAALDLIRERTGVTHGSSSE